MELQEVLYEPRIKLSELAEYDFLHRELMNHLTPIETYMLCKTSKQFSNICNKSINEIIEKGIKNVDSIDFFYTAEDHEDIITTFIIINQKLNVTFDTTSKYILPDITVFSIEADHTNLYILDTSGSLYRLAIENIYNNKFIPEKINVNDILSITSSNYEGCFMNTLNGVYYYDGTNVVKIYDDYVKYISTGYEHYTMISQNNHLLAFGTIGDVDLSKMTSFHDVVHVVSGQSHTIVVTKNKVYSFGNNKFGQLGTGDKLEYNGAVNVTKNINPKSIISCGDFNTTVLYQGKLYAYGWDATNMVKSSFRQNTNPLTKFNIDGLMDVYCRDSLTLLLVEKDEKKYIYNYQYYILKQGYLGRLYNNYSYTWEIPTNYHFTQL